MNLGLNKVSVSPLCPCRDWNEKLLQDASRLLSGEMDLSPSAPGGMVDFRRTLTLSFFFKFYLTVLQKLSKSGTVSAPWEGRFGEGELLCAALVGKAREGSDLSRVPPDDKIHAATAARPTVLLA